MDRDLPEDEMQKKYTRIVKEVLGKDFIGIGISQFILREDIQNNCSQISCFLTLKNGSTDSILIEGAGNGMVDALFNCIIEQLNDKYMSLRQIEFGDFGLKVKLKESRRWRKSDAPVEIRLALRSGDNKKLYFKAQSTSLVGTTILGMQKAFEYLINAELAVVQLHKNIQDAKKRNRTDLVSQYTKQLTELVRIISYEQTIKNLRAI